jgi:1-acyl-sn-glycerol-3-phosphate acyltransferase
MEPGPLSLLIIAATITASAFVWWLAAKARVRGHDDVVMGILTWIGALFVRGLWRAEFHGAEKLPPPETTQGLVIVSNHTSGLDPVLIQYLMPFKIRWLMSRRMMISTLGFLWRRLRVIPVDFNGKDRAAVRAALSGLEDGRNLSGRRHRTPPRGDPSVSPGGRFHRRESGSTGGPGTCQWYHTGSNGLWRTFSSLPCAD